MNHLTGNKHRQALSIYLVILAMAALGAGLSDNILSNYFKDAYQVTAFQRGLIEIPREAPGVIGIFIVTALIALGDIRIAAIAQALMIVGLLFLGFLTPPYAIMLVFIFIHSLGGHIWYPLQDSIGMQLIRDDRQAGKTVGNYKAISTAFGMLASLIVFFGFRYNLFSFMTPVKYVFLLSAAIFFVAFLLLIWLRRLQTSQPEPQEADEENPQPETGETIPLPVQPALQRTSRTGRMKFIFRWEYKYYYILAIVFGVQKQIMFVFAPWVLIELLNKKADSLAMLHIIASLIGIFFIPTLGRLLDRFGIRKMLYADALSFIVVYLLYGFFSAGFDTGFLARAGLPVIFVSALFIIDRMSMQMGMIRSLYLRNIALRPSDIGPTLTMGQSMDHIVSILCATLGGIVWSAWGPQYVFFLAALFSGVNFVVARIANINETAGQRQ